MSAYQSFSAANAFTLALMPFDDWSGAATKKSCTILTSLILVSNNSKSNRRTVMATVRYSSAYARLQMLSEKTCIGLESGTHFMPRHCLLPLPKGTKYLWRRCVPSAARASHRSGSKLSGFGKTVGFRKIRVIVSDTGVCIAFSSGSHKDRYKPQSTYSSRNRPALVYQIFMGYAREPRGRTVGEPQAFRDHRGLYVPSVSYPSPTHESYEFTIYGNCSSVDHGGSISGSGMARTTSSLNFLNLSGFSQR